jgi:Arc/MetJ-type ribon-helix-helix transcriptional regulator
MSMEVRLTPEREAFIRQAVKSGRLRCAADAVQQALSLWERQERNRVEILAALGEAEGELETGQYGDYTDETLPLLVEQLKAEARVLRDQRF